MREDVIVVITGSYTSNLFTSVATSNYYNHIFPHQFTCLIAVVYTSEHVQTITGEDVILEIAVITGSLPLEVHIILHTSE